MSIATSTMITWFNQYYDKETNFSAPGYEPSEILVFLNNAQKTFVKDRTFGKGFGKPAFEDNQKRLTDLMSLVQYQSYTSTSDFFTYPGLAKCRYFATSAADSFYYIVSVEVQVTRSYPVVAAEWVSCDFIRNIDAHRFDVITTNKPFFLKPKYFVLSNSCMVMFDAYTTAYMDGSTHDARLRYIRAPWALSIGGPCMFHESVVQEIVNIAVREAMQVSQDQRFETKVIEEERIKTQ